MTALRTRFAPSPTGRLHLGNARTALFAYLLARSTGGTFILRIEDTDAARSRPEFEYMIARDLEWLGIVVDEGPDRPGDFGPYRQSERIDHHRAAVAQLVASGHAYPCFCTAEDLELARREAIATHRAPRYSGRCRERTREEREALIAAGARPAIRFRSPHRDVVVNDLLRGEVRFRGEDLDDVIIARSDGAVSFLLASALDDADMRVTHVLRGDDHLPNTPRQMLMLEALGLEAPAYGHLGLIHGEHGRPLSKREGDFSVAALRDAGFLPGAVVATLAHLGWSPPDVVGNPIDAYARAFRIENLSAAPCAWDAARLTHENARALRAAPLDELLAHLSPKFDDDFATDHERCVSALKLLQGEIVSVDDLREKFAVFHKGALALDADARDAVSAPSGESVLRAILDALETESELTLDRFQSVVKMASNRTGLKGKGLYMPIRVALTGRTHGPAIASTAAILGLDEVRLRLRKTLESISSRG